METVNADLERTLRASCDLALGNPDPAMRERLEVLKRCLWRQRERWLKEEATDELMARLEWNGRKIMACQILLARPVEPQGATT